MFALSKTHLYSLILATATTAAISASADGAVDVSKIPPAATVTGVTFAKHIKPIFDSACIKCHGEEKQKAKLRLDSLEWILKGADGEPILKKGKSAESELVHSVARLNEDEAMPPEGKGDPLTKEQIGLIRAWIDQGAK